MLLPIWGISTSQKVQLCHAPFICTFNFNLWFNGHHHQHTFLPSLSHALFQILNFTINKPSSTLPSPHIATVACPLARAQNRRDSSAFHAVGGANEDELTSGIGDFGLICRGHCRIHMAAGVTGDKGQLEDLHDRYLKGSFDDFITTSVRFEGPVMIQFQKENLDNRDCVVVCRIERSREICLGGGARGCNMNMLPKGTVPPNLKPWLTRIFCSYILA